MEQPILQLNHIKKNYPGVVALNDVTLGFNRGEVHAIVGENGAGKSTFIKAITGAINPTKGEILYQGEVIVGNSPIKSLELGIAAIYQEFTLIPSLSIAENIYLGRYPKTHGMVDYHKMSSDAKEVLGKLGIQIDPTILIRDLSVGFQQIVEIARAVSREISVLIMDEPSAPLTQNEMVYLYQIIRVLKENKVAILYISHRMEEIFDICDKVSVFRDGEYIQTMDVKDTNQEELIRLMVNRELGNQYPPRKGKRGKKILEVKNLETKLLKNINFSAYEGEILGFAGLVGAGRTEVARAIFGADKRKQGEIYLDHQICSIKNPKEAIKYGIGLIPEDRKREGILLKMSIIDNISYAALHKISFLGIMKKKVNKKFASDYIKALKVKTPSEEQLVRNLSGGNQQKVVLAKWLMTNSRVLIFDEPTRGIDVGGKQEIYELMNQLVAEGKVVIMISSEMPELLGMADRILVMKEGRITGELMRLEATQEKILTLSSSSIEEITSPRKE